MAPPLCMLCKEKRKPGSMPRASKRTDKVLANMETMMVVVGVGEDGLIRGDGGGPIEEKMISCHFICMVTLDPWNRQHWVFTDGLMCFGPFDQKQHTQGASKMSPLHVCLDKSKAKCKSEAKLLCHSKAK